MIVIIPWQFRCFIANCMTIKTISIFWWWNNFIYIILCTLTENQALWYAMIGTWTLILCVVDQIFYFTLVLWSHSVHFSLDVCTAI